MINELANTRYGAMWTMTNDNCIGRSLRKYGEWAEHEISLLRQTIKPGALVLDIGANIGTHTVAFSEMVGETGHVVAFEPQHRIFQLLCANVVANDLTNVTTRNEAVGDRKGACRIEALDYKLDGNNLGGGRVLDTGAVDCAIVMVDNIKMPRCDLIKADVEGSELAVLRGAGITIEMFKPVLYLEFHDNQDEILKFLRQRNYQVFLHPTSPFNRHNFIGDSEDIFGDYVERNVICFPPGRTVEIGLERLL